MSSESAVVPRTPWAQRARGYLALARISNSPTVVSNTLAGAALAGALRPDDRVAAVAVAMVLFYTAGMYLNDLCDYTIDRLRQPLRPLPSGAVSRTEAAIAVVALFGIGSALLWFVGPATFRSGLVLIAVIVVYDFWHKANPLSPLLMATARALVYITAGLAVAGTLPNQLFLWAGLLFAYIVGMTAIAKAEAGSGLAGICRRLSWPCPRLLLSRRRHIPRLGCCSRSSPDGRRMPSRLSIVPTGATSAARSVTSSPASRSWMRWPWQSLVQ